MFDFGTIFPYSDLHKLNLDWILKKVASLDGTIEEINTYISDTLPGVIENEVNRQLVLFAVHTYYSADDHALNFGIETGVVTDAIHYIKDGSLVIEERKEC